MNSETRIISKSYLTGLIIKCSLLFAGGLLLTGIILYFSSHQPLGPSYQESFARLAQLKHEMLVKSISIYCLFMILIISGVIFITVIYSHRVVGPLVGLTRIIKAIAAGDFTQVARMREKDAITLMADALNDMRDACLGKLQNITRKIDDLQTLLNSPNPTELSSDLASKAREIKKELLK